MDTRTNTFTGKKRVETLQNALLPQKLVVFDIPTREMSIFFLSGQGGGCERGNSWKYYLSGKELYLKNCVKFYPKIQNRWIIFSFFKWIMTLEGRKKGEDEKWRSKRGE